MNKLIKSQKSSSFVRFFRFLSCCCDCGLWMQWVDKQGRTPLILACAKAELYDVAKTLLDLGSNVDAYRSGNYYY